jgi:hypothetical protein
LTEKAKTHKGFSAKWWWWYICALEEKIDN